MGPLLRAAGCAACAATFLAAQNSDVFEVASVKPSSPDATRVECSGGPGTASPKIWRCSNTPLWFLIARAYGFEAYQFPPNADCCRARFDFAAQVPPETTRKQFEGMLRNLLVERFRLAFHYDRREMPVFELTVDAKGLKMKLSARNAGPEPDPWEIPAYTVGKDGYPEFPAGRGGLAGSGGRYRWTGSHISLQEIARTLSFHLGRPLVDATGLTGGYDLDLRWGIDMPWLLERSGHRDEISQLPETGPPGPPLVRAVQDQLGLKLISTRGMGEIVIVDHVEKVPPGN